MTVETARCPVREFHLQRDRVLPRDPFEVYADFRESEPFWTAEHGGYWVFTRYDQCKEILSDSETFSHVNASVPPANLDKPLFNWSDPPQLTKLRQVLLPLLTPEKIDPLEPRMREVCRNLIGTFSGSGSCELVDDFARKYPIAIFGDLFGLDRDRREEFRQLAETFLHDYNAKQEAWSAIRDLMGDALENASTVATE